jgi:hypothetical protein
MKSHILVCVVVGPAVDSTGEVVVNTDDTARDRVLVVAKVGWGRTDLVWVAW